MFVSTRDIRRRINNLNGNYQIRHDINIHALSESSLRDVNTFETYIDNWQDINKDNHIAFEGLLKSTRKFFNESKSKSDCNKAITIIREKVLPNVENLKRARVSLSKYKDIDIDNKLMEECNVLVACDRVVSNQEKLNKIYDINKIIKESRVHDEESLNECIFSLCEAIDSIDIDLDIKYNLALENILYSLEKNYIPCNRPILLESITNYFLCKYTDDTSTIKEILSESVYYNDKDKEQIDFLLDDEDLDMEDILSIQPITETSLKKNEVKEILNKVKALPKQSPGLIKSAITKIYTKSPNNIIEETPNFLSWIRQFIMFSTLGINFYLGCVVLFVDYFIKMSLEKKETEKFLKKFKNEKELIEKKIDKIKNETSKKRLEEYNKTLDNNIKKIEVYRDTLYTGEELMDMNENTLRQFLEEDIISKEEYIKEHHDLVIKESIDMCNIYNNITKSLIHYKKLGESTFSKPNTDEILLLKQSKNIESYIGESSIMIPIAEVNTNNNDNILEMTNHIVDKLRVNRKDNFNILCENTDDISKIYLTYDFKLDNVNESNIHVDSMREMSLILGLEESMKKISESSDVNNILYNNINIYDEETIDLLTEYALNEESFVDTKELVELMESYKNALYKSDNIGKYRMGSCLQENMFKIKTNRKSNNVERNRYEVYNDITSINEALEALSSIQEGAMKNNIIIAKEKLKKSALRLSDKEKAVSRQLDSALGNFNEKIMRELSNKNRESVIKGSILPSASTCIKLALTTGAVALINPALAVVTALGALAMSKAGTKREKQFILDEIDIQLKLVEKKIQLAENNNDMKALEQLLKLEQKLKREKQRIIYRLKHYHPVAIDK